MPPCLRVLDPALGLIGRSRDSALLDLAVVQAVLAGPPAPVCTHPESGALRSLSDCPDVPLGAGGPCVRLIVARHPATSTSVSIGKKRDGMVDELFITRLAGPAFSAKDVLDLDLHRRSFETVLADEDLEQDPDRWCSHTPCGQEVWQIIGQWVWKLRLELGQQLSPARMRTTEFAPAFQALLSRFNRMEACFVPPIIRSIEPRTQTGAPWLVASGVCGPDQRLPPMRVADSVSRKPFHRQTTTSQCGDLPSLFPRGHCRCASHCCTFACSQTHSSPATCSRPLGGLATLSDPSPLAQRAAQRNRRSDEGISNGETNTGHRRTSHDPATTGSLASLMA
jgi:hypothetical protein